MELEIIFSIIIPFIGTILGSALIFVFKKLNDGILRSFSGFAAGVMVAASIFSLIIPSLEIVGEEMGKLSFIPIIVGLVLGFGFLMLLDKVIPHQHTNSEECEGPRVNLKKSTMTSLAVALHNLPEGIAVGVVLASTQVQGSNVTLMMGIALAIGIAIQNFPEGAIVSLSMNSSGVSKGKSFGLGVASGIVEPLGAIITILLVDLIHPALPYLLSFAAGAMLFVVVEELIPDMAKGKHSHLGTIMFGIGFSFMLILEIILG